MAGLEHAEQVVEHRADVAHVDLDMRQGGRAEREHDRPRSRGVGAAFDFHAGLVPQAPEWMQRFGLEWAYRLAHEPRRLWKRYARYNPLFVGGFARQYLRARFGRKPTL